MGRMEHECLTVERIYSRGRLTARLRSMGDLESRPGLVQRPQPAKSIPSFIGIVPDPAQPNPHPIPYQVQPPTTSPPITAQSSPTPRLVRDRDT